MQIFLLAAEKARDLNEYNQQKNLSIVEKSREISRAFDSEAQVGDTREQALGSGKDFIDRKTRSGRITKKNKFPTRRR